MSKLTVEKGNPIPPRNQWTKHLRELKQGYNLLVSEDSYRTRILRAAHRAGIRVTSRKVDGKGYRIWKTGRRRA